MKSPGRSVLSILAGFVLVVVLSLVTDVVMTATHVFPAQGFSMPDLLLAIALAYRTIFAIAGSYLTARLAPVRPMVHALFGGVLGTLIGTAGAIATWHSPVAVNAHWYPVLLAATAIPDAWIGGLLFLSGRSARTASR